MEKRFGGEPIDEMKLEPVTPEDGQEQSADQKKLEKWHRWNEIVRTMDEEDDMDKKIKGTIVALNAMGIKTVYSCEGHHHNAPWVKVETPRSVFANPETEEKIEAKRQLISKLSDFLDEFYKKRQAPKNVGIILDENEEGDLYLHSGGEDFKDMKKKISEKKLEMCQNEFRKFAKFLKEKYFKE